MTSMRWVSVSSNLKPHRIPLAEVSVDLRRDAGMRHAPDFVTSSLNGTISLVRGMKRLRKTTSASSDEVGDDGDEVEFS